MFVNQKLGVLGKKYIYIYIFKSFQQHHMKIYYKKWFKLGKNYKIGLEIVNGVFVERNTDLFSGCVAYCVFYKGFGNAVCLSNTVIMIK